MMDGWIDRTNNGWMDGWMDGWTYQGKRSPLLGEAGL